jgi:hypothetical protein
MGKIATDGVIWTVTDKTLLGIVRILVQMVHPVGIEQRGPALDTVDDVTFV